MKIKRLILKKSGRILVFSIIFLLLFALTIHAGGPVVDSHFHIANYAMQGVSLKTLIDRYMGDKVLRSVVFPLPLQQKWDPFEHFGNDSMPPNYYLGTKAGMYYYSFIDTMVAMDYLRLSDADKARLDPMIVGFNPMDKYGVQHIKRMLLLFPGVFAGIGEFSVHKEIVADKISDDPVLANIPPGEPMPPDATYFSKNSLYNPNLETIFDFAAEAGLIVNLHSDIYPARVTYNGKLISAYPEKPYTAGMKHLGSQSPETIVCWAHTGLGRFVKPAPDHLETVSEILDACPNWYSDLSWDIVQQYIVEPEPGMPSLDEWADFVTKYQDRVLWGSDTVIFTKNKFDDEGRPLPGTEMPVADYLAVVDILNPLWEKVGPVVTRKVRMENHLRLFDAARQKVREWEAAHAQENVWNLPAM
jgi:predicted TIM-barrel fold metal-dependent hydrolase